jgi:uncharacterized protein (UPF0371 family)
VDGRRSGRCCSMRYDVIGGRDECMARKVGFDGEAYIREQTAAILERLNGADHKLYLEFGGKLVLDHHAARVLPGFDPNAKMQLLRQLRADAEIILCIYAGDIERRKVRADFGVTYDVDALRLMDAFGAAEVGVAGVVITRFEGQPSARVFRNKLERRGIRVYTHRATRDYPTDIDLVVSDEGYGANEVVETCRPLVIVTGPGPGSGKMATCLSQMYHDCRAGLRPGYAKFETFPIWNLPLKHPVNVAYEAATADLNDINMIDPFHLEAYGETAVNYNRDVEAFPLLRRLLERVTGSESPYQSPTDMGVNRAGFAIIDDAVVREAGRQEVIRRYFRHRCEYALGVAEMAAVERVTRLMDELGAEPETRSTVVPAREAAEEARHTGKGHKGIFCGAALELADGRIITGKNSPLMHAASSLVLNAIKVLSGIPDDMHLLSPVVIESVAGLKETILSGRSASLDLEEALIALSVSATTNPAAQRAVEELRELSGCDAHLTHMPTAGDEAGLKSLGIHLTSDPSFSSASLFEQ